ncbi:glypican-3 [Astyanax mexicanus]|uniref:Glypican-3 n=1 Tax=Astyanax mexicanus TaxID=7994 RepID=A0A8T2LSP2_ASTMX|nr:glypican-3 [Astyanax mexicanus]
MSGGKLALALLWCALLVPASVPSAPGLRCHQVRSSFQSLYPGTKWAPETPVSGSDLQVCQPKGLTCCSRKMEERYLLTAKQNMESGLQASSGQLKLLIIQNAALFQEAFDMVLRLGRNSTLAMLREEFPALVGGASGAVTQLFLEMSLYILGSEANVDDMVTSFFSRLFPLAYRRVLGNGATLGTSEDCLRGAWRESSAFGSYPKLMMTRLSHSLPATRVFLQALNLGIEVVNTTQHLKAGRDCGRALLRLWYCPHCQGLLEARPCRALCLSTMGSCLGGAAEVQPHWRSYVEGLGTLDSSMRGEQDMEEVVLRLHVIIKLALKHAVGAKTRLNTQVSSMCTHTPQRVTRGAASPAEHAVPSTVVRSTQPANPDPDQTLVGRRREFIQSLRGFSLFYGGLGEALCNREPAALNSSLCWNGQEMTDKLTGPGLKRPHPHGSETKQKPPEPVVSQIIDKLKHINQLLRMVTTPEKRWKARAGGGATRKDPKRQNQGLEDEEGLESGDCDDEDECTGVSGLGPPPRRKRLRIFADLADNLAMDDLTFHELLLTPRLATDSHGGASAPGAAQAVRVHSCIFSLTFILLLLCGLH